MFYGVIEVTHKAQGWDATKSLLFVENDSLPNLNKLIKQTIEENTKRFTGDFGMTISSKTASLIKIINGEEV